MKLEKMSRPNLLKWISNLEKSINYADCEYNKKLFEKFHKEATNELSRRDEARNAYCKRYNLK